MNALSSDVNVSTDGEKCNFFDWNSRISMRNVVTLKKLRPLMGQFKITGMRCLSQHPCESERSTAAALSQEAMWSRMSTVVGFHGLDAFDEGKRSCRNRLEGHNKRRRKPQPDPLGFSARFLPAFQDNSRLGQLFADRSSFLPQMRIPGVSAHWDDGNPSHQQKGNWQQQKMISFEDQAAYECSIPAGAGIERPLFTVAQRRISISKDLSIPWVQACL
ncbi:hypothetical protein GOP47_0008287 [Adiantum capillus-veneris]|uniref:SBP-type domain-containing protein n=1 Tax=Adiantum capillus-veneris TaxID=13818 RepID=A0A9D4ZJJ3_ADICA|nr:hypothetical protein GOP47_0008287 [Adiantum capillus-veneris]